MSAATKVPGNGTEAKSTSVTNNSSKHAKRKRYLANKPGKKGSFSLRPGVQGFFITCDGGKERKASYEAINVIDSFYEAIVEQGDPDVSHTEFTGAPANKKIKFVYSDSSDEDDNSDEDDDDKTSNGENQDNGKCNAGTSVCETEGELKTDDCKDHERQLDMVELPQAKKQCLETTTVHNEVGAQAGESSIDKLIEAEIRELGDRSKRRFFHLDSGCNGVAFVQMCKREGDPSPSDIVHNLMTSVASTRKHLSRFILRLLPIEMSCYASEEDIGQAIEPLISKYFPVDSATPHKFAVLFEARANTGIERARIIDVVAKSVPSPHKVNLGNPDKTIVVQIVKTVCLVGVVERYKELCKYNLRQLTSGKS